MKKWIAGLSAATLVFTCSGCTKEESSLTPVRLNEVVHSVFYAPQYVAMELGFFEEEGIKLSVDIGNGADNSMVALLSDSADIALMGTEAGIYVYNEGKEDCPVAFAQLTQRAGNFLIAREPMPDFQWEDLEGKSVIGGRAGGMPELVLEHVLSSHGLTPKEDVDIIQNIDFSSTAGAFLADMGDFTVEFEPTATTLENQGVGYVVASLGVESGYIPYTVYMANPDFLEEHEDLVIAFTRAIYKGQTWVMEHSAEEIAEVIAPQFPDSDLESLTKIIERYKEQDTWKADPSFSEADFELIQDIMEEGGELSQRVPFASFVNTEIAATVMGQN